MQTYTHVMVGLAVGMAIAPNNGQIQAACVVGSCLPDITIVPLYLIDRAKGRVLTFANWSQWLPLVEAIHSLIIWLLALLIVVISTWMWGNQWLVMLCAGGLIHIIIDLPTHGGLWKNRYTELDVGFLWPWKFKLGKLFGIYEYRDLRNPGLIPKWPEAIFLAAVIIVAIYLYIH